VQPLLWDSARFSNDATLLLFNLQVVETISEMCRGPHERNQRLALSSNFLSAVNRVFATLLYVGEDATVGHVTLQPDATADETAHVRLNDVICWFKEAVAACVLSFCDLVTDPEVPRKLIRAFEVENLVAHMATEAERLGFETRKSNPRLDTSAPKPSHSLSNDFNPLGRPAEAARVMPEKSRAESTALVEGGQTEGRGVEKLDPGRTAMVRRSMFGMYVLLLNLQDFETWFKSTEARKVRQSLTRLKKECPELHSHLKRHTTRIEIARKKGSKWLVEYVYFPIEGKMIHLSASSDLKDRVQEILEDIPRGNAIETRKELLVHIKRLIQWIRWSQYLQKAGGVVLDNLVLYRSAIHKLSLLPPAAITLCLLTFYGIPLDPNTGGLLAYGSL